MSYIPVGTLLTYTATIKYFLTHGYTDWQSLSAALSDQLRNNLPGQEELDVESSGGSTNFLSASINLSLQVLNNGVDHGDENDVKSIIDGTIQGLGSQIISSSITKIQLPNNPLDDNSNQIIVTGANSNAPAPTNDTSKSSSGGLFSGLSLSGGSIFGLSTTVIIVAIVALILLLPGGFLKIAKGVR